MKPRLATIALAALALWSCSGADATPMVRARAADDLVCAESTVRVLREVDGTYTAIGCGKRLSYRALCEGTQCAVSREGEGLKSPPPNSPAPEPPGYGGR
ncbi:MAG: hypothetical protein HY898_04715 [Deltaproteobacteria bacterium]|nr:hypothetical protein [Deltaproteobacteria bacterium]